MIADQASAISIPEESEQDSRSPTVKPRVLLATIYFMRSVDRIFSKLLETVVVDILCCPPKKLILVERATKPHYGGNSTEMLLQAEGDAMIETRSKMKDCET